jgi:hypothetical protein
MEDNSPEKKRITYNLEMAKALRAVKPPIKGIIMDIKPRPNYLALVIYESNIMQFDETRRGDIMEYLLMCRDIILSYGVPCELEGSRGAPPKKSMVD